VEKDLIKNELSKLLIDYDVRVNNCITRIDAIKKELDEHNNLSIKAFKEYINVFHEMEILVSNGSECNKCLWLCERKYLSIARAAIDLQCTFANFLVHTWDEVIAIEEMRVLAVKSVMLTYMKARSEIFSALSSAETATESLSMVEVDKDQLTPEKVLTKEEQGILLKETGLSDYKKAIQSWKFPSAPETSLILIEGELWRESGSRKRWKKCLVVVTRDRFLHVLSGREE